MTTPRHHSAIRPGKRFGVWYVVAFAGQREGIDFWQCICCRHDVERLFAAPTLPGLKTNELWPDCRCRPQPGGLTDYVYGLWTVIGPAEPPQESPRTDDGRSWKCRCACGTERVLKEEVLAAGRSLSCGCRPENEVRKELKAKGWTANERLWKWRQSLGRAAPGGDGGGEGTLPPWPIRAGTKDSPAGVGILRRRDTPPVANSRCGPAGPPAPPAGRPGRPATRPRRTGA
jgi:hypothetical protein